MLRVWHGPGELLPRRKEPRLREQRREREGGLFVVNLDGTGLREITPSGVVDPDYGGRWSPSGNQILFDSSSGFQHYNGIWVVNSDGSGRHRIPVPGCGGWAYDQSARGCRDPSWSPDGTKIIFPRNVEGGEGYIYTVNTDGTGLTLAAPTGVGEPFPDWGVHPLAH